jgi:hypothetical protein
MLPQSHQLSLKLLERCPSCRASIPSANIHIIDETDTQVIAHVLCPRCAAKHLASITHQPNGIIGNAIPTDLSYTETLSMLEEVPLTDDQVLALYTKIHASNFITELQLDN